MRTSFKLAVTILAGGTLAGCHHRQAEPVYTTPTTETVTTTTTTSSTSSDTMGAMPMTTTSTVRRERSEPGQGARSERRELRMAMASLERARRELERAGHDFGGHKGDAMKATDAALHELRLASGLDAREERTGVETARERRAEEHELHVALADLERSRADLEHSTHNFNGRRKEALEAVDAAIREIRQAAEFEK